MARDDKRSPIDDIRMNTFRAMLSDAFHRTECNHHWLDDHCFFRYSAFSGMANWLWLAIGGDQR
ncbi:MAG: hypothetical protein HS103_00570 [Anaerolineales bacterium]|nr:hypothetical protein [Anaerolineales bacterium]